MEKEKYDLAKWLSGEMSEKERHAFEQSPEFETYNKIAKYSANLQTPHFEDDLVLDKIMAQPKKKVVQLKINWALRIAAVFIIGIGLFSFWQLSTVTESANGHQKNNFSLPDASQVVLNSKSEIRYKKYNWKNHRTLYLTGEAYFKVAKGKTFDVHTDLGKVTVVGTQFNVKVLDSVFEVHCYEGKVRVKQRNETVILTKGESVVFNHGTSKKGTIATTKPAWIGNEMVFESKKLHLIIAEMERQYNIKIELINNENDLAFTGTIPSNNIAIALKIITKTFNLQAKKINDSKIILAKNE